MRVASLTFLGRDIRYHHPGHFRIKPTNAIAANDKVGQIEDMPLDENATRRDQPWAHLVVEREQPAESQILPSRRQDLSPWREALVRAPAMADSRAQPNRRPADPSRCHSAI
jgi:hypothetical protein